uniref:Uncharacterized protein n=1 Tax=Glossina palpalis gambiensis TaxID=67801 RepID=A0A1B0AR76_9MUSC
MQAIHIYCLCPKGGGGSWVNLFLVQLVETAQWPNTHNTNANRDLMRVEGLSHASSACLILLNMCGE